jgi:hypothetical protein
MRTDFFVFSVGGGLAFSARLLFLHVPRGPMQTKVNAPLSSLRTVSSALRMSSAVLRCGAGAPAACLNDWETRKGFPDMVKKTRNNALFYVHECTDLERRGEVKPLRWT